jgi:CMP-2-keto-3-deoxyoctulosonic acid synthetase
MNILGVIPARYGSTRLPGKLEYFLFQIKEIWNFVENTIEKVNLDWAEEA